ncbi:hypothetical protein BJX68DRAFT_263138 [Aspergillus pseudodeflectus]|uniref:Uncharacterized protein n=1 Tax=Aspergillus pseudodeflectus TaxID=176178 RepID=A0ABR4KZE1_9EURO
MLSPSLSPQILELIAGHLASLHTTTPRKDPYGTCPTQVLALYTTITRNRQLSLERYTFDAIRSNTPDLPNLRRLIGTCPPPPKHLRQLASNIDLPLYPKDSMRFFQRDQDEYNSLLAVQHGIKALFDELASWTDDVS